MFKLDTGAQTNIISEKLFRSVSLPNSTLEKTGVKLVTYDGHRINPVGTTVLKCTFKKRNYVLKFFVVPNDTHPILSADARTELGVIVRVRAVDTFIKLYNCSIDINNENRLHYTLCR